MIINEDLAPPAMQSFYSDDPGVLTLEVEQTNQQETTG